MKEAVTETSVVDNDTSRSGAIPLTEQQKHDEVESQPIRKQLNVGISNAKILEALKYRRGVEAVAGI